jgi:hypothetical protein
MNLRLTNLALTSFAFDEYDAMDMASILDCLAFLESLYLSLKIK